MMWIVVGSNRYSIQYLLARQIAPDNNAMHAKSGLRVVFSACKIIVAVEIQGEAYEINTISDITFEYTYYYQRVTNAESSSSFSELDVILFDKSTERRINLLSQTSDWALKHARQLERLTGARLKRTSVAR